MHMNKYKSCVSEIIRYLKFDNRLSLFSVFYLVLFLIYGGCISEQTNSHENIVISLKATA